MIDKLIVYSPSDIVDSQVTWFKQLGYQYTGSTFKDNSLKKLLFKKKIFGKNNNNNNNISNSNSILDNSSITENNNNIKYFQILLYVKLLEWFGMQEIDVHRVYDQDYLDRLEEHNPKLVYDQELIEHYHSVKNQCALHASTNKPFKLLYHTMVESNRSRLQLTLISKDLFEYISINFFNNTYYYPTQKSQYNVLKTFTSITCFKGQQQQRQQYLQSTTIISWLKDADKNITRIITPMASDLEYIPLFHSLSVLDLSPSAYSTLPDNIKLSLRSISVDFSAKDDYYNHLEKEFPKLTSLVIMKKTSKVQQLPKTIKKIMSKCKQAIDFLPLNQSVVTFKLFSAGYSLHGILDKLSPIKHVKTVTLQIESSPPLDLDQDTDFKLHSIVSKPPICLRNKRSDTPAIYSDLIFQRIDVLNK
ncbi:hypothetical protein DFA_07931 [Cavenderia fasciculata]|uniref:Uncharacterized protein n=1 Tax=Cavenderia fasciculata TaxID=261658 RepID=F4Q436_CACFS|nr:uncharacterized protein DFA_07931 [Cavenderia fasciculata]EGG16950.1 hypothetical protein DFA_07931 [Cavenderia fasciculata]|eukprot:XP_004355424.1 hypothetical protein DFA_07931 [Cavenderia fasciculata]